MFKPRYRRDEGILQPVSTSLESDHYECLLLYNGRPCSRVMLSMWSWDPSLERVQSYKSLRNTKHRSSLYITVFTDMVVCCVREVCFRFGKKVLPSFSGYISKLSLPLQKRSLKESQIFRCFTLLLTELLGPLSQSYPPSMRTTLIPRSA
jgi:hypothetical protein